MVWDFCIACAEKEINQDLKFQVFITTTGISLLILRENGWCNHFNMALEFYRWILLRTARFGLHDTTVRACTA